MKHRRTWPLPWSLLVVLLLASVALGQEATREQLKERFESRYEQLAEAKDAGRVGETWQGFVAVVETPGAADGAARRLVDEENADRRALYALLAREIAADLDEPERSRMTPRVVAERNAWRNFERAGSTQPLRVAERTWVTKKERPWLLRLLELERQGRIGEARNGDVAPVPGAADGNGDVARVVELENQARRAFRERLAREVKLPLEQVARRQAQRFAKAVHLGVFVQSADGSWEPVLP